MTQAQNFPFSPVRYGGFSNRMLASTLDIGLLYIFVMPVIEYISIHAFAPMDLNEFLKVWTMPELQGNASRMAAALWEVAKTQHLPERMIIENLVQIAFIALYILPFWFIYSTTPGKMLFRLTIRDGSSGEKMTRRQAVIRFLGYIVSTVPFSLGFIWMLFNRRRRGFHDYIAGTVVLVKPKSARALSSAPPSAGP